MKKYLIITTDVTFEVTYRGNRFLRLERKRGKMTKDQRLAIGKIIPFEKSEISEYAKRFSQIEYKEVVKDKTIYQKFTDTWFAFYQEFSGYEPRFNGVEGRSLKSIITYLRKISGSDDDALLVWKTLLSNWNNLSDFHKKNTDLKYINGNIQKLLENVKTDSKKTTKYSEGFKQKITESLFSG